jgi:hypothetical protein
MQILDPLRAREGVRCHQDTSRGDAGEQRQQRQDHRASGRVVPEMAGRPQSGGTAEIGEHLSRRPDEVDEAGMLRSGKAPGDPEQDEGRDGVAGWKVQPLDLVPVTKARANRPTKL